MQCAGAKETLNGMSSKTACRAIVYVDMLGDAEASLARASYAMHTDGVRGGELQVCLPAPGAVAAGEQADDEDGDRGADDGPDDRERLTVHAYDEEIG